MGEGRREETPTYKSVPGRRRFRRNLVQVRTESERAPTEADAPLDNERPVTTYLLVTVSPGRHRFPLGTGEVPCCAGGASPCAQSSSSASFFQTKFKKWQALSQSGAEASCVQ